MIRDSRTSFMTAFAAILIATSAPSLLAQNDRHPPAPPPAGESGPDGADDLMPPEGPDFEASPERMKEVLERQVERNIRERKALDEAIEMLGRGEPVEKVREHMRGVMRDGLRDRAQQFRDGRRPRQPGPGGPGGPDGPGERRRPPGDPPPPQEMERGGPPPHPPGGPGGPGGPPPPGGGPRPMERLLGVLRETNPRMADRLERLRREDPEQFQKLFDDFAPKLARLAEERERLPDRWPDRVKQLLLQQRAGGLAREIAAMPADQQKDAMEKLRANLGEQFDIRLKFAREDLERNKEQAQRLQREISEKSGDKDAAIERQMQEMLDRAKSHTEPSDALSPGVL